MAKKKKRYPVLTASGIAIFLAVLLFYSYQRSKIASQNEEAARIHKLVLRSYSENRTRNFDQAIATGKEISQENTRDAATASQLVEGENYLFILDHENQKKGIDILKLIAGDASVSAVVRSWAINKLLGAYFTNEDPFLAEQIFSGAPFQDLAKDADESLAIRKLGEYSDKLNPTSFAKLHIAIWYSLQLLDNKNLSAELKKEYAAKIQELVTASDKLFKQELVQFDYPPEAQSMLFDNFKAFHQATLTLKKLNKPGEETLFEQTFKEIFKYDDPTAGSPNLTYSFLPYAHFYYAAFLYEIYGGKRLAEVRTHAAWVANTIKTDPTPEKNVFRSFMRIKRDENPKKRNHNYTFFVELASVSREFAAMLQSEGWNLR